MLLITTIGVIVAVAGVYIAYLTYRQGDDSQVPEGPVASGPSASLQGVAFPSSSSSSSSSSASTATATGSTSLCGLPESGMPVDCRDPRAALRVTDQTCSLRTVMTLWTLNPDLDSLDIKVSERSGICWVSPGDIARQAGASAADLVQASKGAVVDALRQCAVGGDLVSVGCSRPHDAEWIGEWAAADDTVDPVASCRVTVVAYTRMTVSGMENRLVAESAERVASGKRQTRCLVRVQGITLNASIRNLRNGQLPVAAG